MDITEPQYFTEFRQYITRRFDESDEKTEKLVEGLAVSTANQFLEIQKEMRGEFEMIDNKFNVIEYEIIGMKQEIKGLATKEDFNEIKSLIGSYEIRSRKIEEILLDDHKPRIKELEKVVFKIA